MSPAIDLPRVLPPRTWRGGVCPALAAALLALAALCLGCGGAAPPARSPTERAADAAPAVAALAASRFDQAATLAEETLARDGGNARAAVVRAITRYQAAGKRLAIELEAATDTARGLGHLDHEAGRAAWQHFADALAAVDGDLAVAANAADFSLELCLACWEHDWNQSGEVDDRDRRLFELEYDGQDEQAGQTGQDDGRAGRRAGTRRLEAGDPRRRPTFRFDTGDAEWARAMVAFQRAAMELLLAYRWAELDRLPMVFGRRGSLEKFIIPLGDAGRVRRAHQLILDGLTHADRCRAAYLAETDDDREWVPNPRQRSYAMPLAVDQSLYQTWADILGDVRRMLRSEEGLSLRALAGLMDDELPALLPDAYLDLGALLRKPTTVTLDLVRLEQLDHAGKDPAKLQPLLEALLRGVLGSGYAAKMKPSPLPSRLARIQRELDLGSDTLERKLRYLIWLN